MKYRKKPVVVDAIQWNGENIEEVKNFVGDALSFFTWFNNRSKKEIELTISTLEGKLEVTVGDYIIKGVEGEFYPCKPNIFEKTYEMVGDV